MVIVEVVTVRAAAHDFEGHHLPGNGKGDAHRWRPRWVFHLVAGKGIVGDCAIGGSGFDANPSGIVGKAGRAAVVGDAFQLIFDVEDVAVIVDRAAGVAQSHVAVVVVSVGDAVGRGHGMNVAGAVGVGQAVETGDVANLVVDVGVAVGGGNAAGAGADQPVEFVVAEGLGVGSGRAQGGHFGDVAHPLMREGETRSQTGPST